MNRKRIIFGIFILLLIVIVVMGYSDTNQFKVNEADFETDLIASGESLKIIQISDLHNKVFENNNEELVKTVDGLDGDIIVLTGDLIDRRTDELASVFDLVNALTSINKHVYFVSGNHEWDNPNFKALLRGLRERDVVILDNKNTSITRNGVSINLVGVADYSTDHHDLKAAFEGIGNDQFTVLLSHAPGIVESPQNTANLTLSGHTHGGQVRLPFIGAVVAPGQGFFPKYDQGVFELTSEQHLYIDSGLGTSMLPVRFLNQSQFSLITIKGKDAR